MKAIGDIPPVRPATVQPILASEPRILDLFADEVAAAGLVGEDRASRLLYLIVTSRLLDKPVSIVVKGPSASGKSFLVSTALAFFPETAYFALSAMSDRALAYSDEPLEHRMLVLYEAAGLGSDFASYLVRSLLSEGRVRYETVEKTKAGLRTRLIEREGPTGLVTTTTAVGLHPENETRLFSLTVTDAPQQTKAILLRMADEESIGTPSMQAWRDLQTWLEEQDNRVTIPFGRLLAAEISPSAIRMRRDFRQLLSLIRASAILHQGSRERDAEGRITATVEDYETVRALVEDLLADAVEQSVTGTIRHTVEAVADLTRSGVEVSAAQVAGQLGLDKSTTSRRLRVAISRGYLKNLEEKRGRPMRLAIGDPLGADAPMLPSLERLQSCMQSVGVPLDRSRPPDLPVATAEPTSSQREEAAEAGQAMLTLDELCDTHACAHQLEAACDDNCETEEELLGQLRSLRRSGWGTEPGGAYVPS